MWYCGWRMEEPKKRRGRKSKFTVVTLEDLNKFFEGDTIIEVSSDVVNAYKIHTYADLNKKIYREKGFKPFPDLNDLNNYLKENSKILVATSFLEQYGTGIVPKKVDEPTKGEYSLDVIKKQEEGETVSFSEEF